MVKISSYLDPKLVTFLGVETRDEVLRAIVEVVSASGKIENKEDFELTSADVIKKFRDIEDVRTIVSNFKNNFVLKSKN